MYNVLLITADQWRAECLSSLGHPTVKTPHLDALAREGVTFTRHYTQCVPCGPSRTSLLTGMYMMNHRSLRNGTPLDARFTSLALEMRKLGYDPALIGYTDTSLDPRGRPDKDPMLHTYAGTMPGFTQLVPGSEGDK
ncbi:MAG: sulfatase-like hydrolase/transferase, partial [Rhodospirillales bacterium]|nr:sulfatase-like hydrolase/transferase [Rhodospirillales bacterium]